MKKYLLTIELRYSRIPKGHWDGGAVFKHIAVGIYNSYEDAMDKGNADIKKILSKYFQVRSEDKFTKSGLCSGNLVSNCCYSTDKVSYFYSIKTLNFLDLETEIQTALNESREYKKWLLENKEDDDD